MTGHQGSSTEVPPADRPSGGNVKRALAGVAGVLVMIALMFGLSALLALYFLDRAVTPDDPPTCDAEPSVVSVEYDDLGWWRSESFELSTRQVVQVDATMSPSGVLPSWTTIHAVRAGTPIDDVQRSFARGSTKSDPTPTEPGPDLVAVGTGVNAINEQVVLEGGTWELLVRSSVGVIITVRWPC